MSAPRPTLGDFERAAHGLREILLPTPLLPLAEEVAPDIWLKPQVRIVAVEPTGCPALHASLAAGAPATVDCDTLCDGVAVPYITDEMFPLLCELADDCVLVSEEEVCAAIRILAGQAHLVAEGSGALALAAALRTPAGERGRSVCLVTGGSIDAHNLAQILTGPA